MKPNSWVLEPIRDMHFWNEVKVLTFLKVFLSLDFKNVISFLWYLVKPYLCMFEKIYFKQLLSSIFGSSGKICNTIGVTLDWPVTSLCITLPSKSYFCSIKVFENIQKSNLHLSLKLQISRNSKELRGETEESRIR